MTTTFRILCTLAIAHSYYSDGCRDFDFVIPADTTGVFRNGKLIAKVLDGALTVLYEADEGASALAPLATAGRFSRRASSSRPPKIAFLQ